MAELAVLGVILGLWRALSAAADADFSRDHLEANLGWALVAVSVLLALTAAVPTSLTVTVPACERTDSCPSESARNLPSLNGAPETPLPMQLTG